VSENEEPDEPEEYQTYFEGPCTCEHEQDDHGWGECGEDDCPCRAGWCE
jgi:hypothetical protein